MRLLNAFGAALAAACLFAAPALAASNYTVTQGTGKTMRCEEVSTVCFIVHMIAKSDGTVINPATSDQIGEVQASPTANTVLDRLKTLKTESDELQALVGEVQVSPTANTALDRLKTVHTDIVAMQALIGEVQTTPTTNTLMDRVKSLLTSINSVIGTKAAGTAAGSSLLGGCVYNTSLPSPTNGQQVGTQCDGSGRHIVAIPSGANPVEGTTSDTSSSNTMFGVLQAIKASASDVTTAQPVKAQDSGGGDATDTARHAVKAIDATGAGTATTSVTRPADTSVYAANDTWANSTSSPTAGGFTLTSVCAVSGGSGILTSLVVSSSVDPSTLLQGEIWLFDSAPTAVNDNAAFTVSDTDVVKIVPGGVIPFTLLSTAAGTGTNSYYAITNLNVAYTCSGSANLRGLVKVKNAYTPASGEVLTIRTAYVATN